MTDYPTHLTDGEVLYADYVNDIVDDVQDKVDKVSGKGLSTNDYTTAEKNKLASIAGTNDGANWTSITIGNETYLIPAGSAERVWIQNVAPDTGAVGVTGDIILCRNDGKIYECGGGTVGAYVWTAMQIPNTSPVEYYTFMKMSERTKLAGIESGAKDNVLIATYGTTSFNTIADALDNGKIVFMKDDSRYIWATVCYYNGDTEICFSGIGADIGETIKQIVYYKVQSGDSWSTWFVSKVSSITASGNQISIDYTGDYLYGTNTITFTTEVV